MKDRSFADFLIGALACISLAAVYTLVNTAQAESSRASAPVGELRRHADGRFELPKRRRRKRTIEDACRHCGGSGSCTQCGPEPCRVCRGNGAQPRDPKLIARLDALWG